MSKEDVGRRLKSLRLSKDLTQGQLAEKLGVAQPSIAMYESGKRIPNQSVISLYSDFFNVSKSYLMYGGDTQISSEDADRLEALHQNPRLGMLFDRTSRMTEEDVDFILAMADRILKERD